MTFEAELYQSAEDLRLGLTITIRAAVGHGPTTLAAFDDALIKTGIANFNLLRLSSVIPPGSVVDVFDPAGEAAPPTPEGDWGDRLYCVYAEERTDVPGQEVWGGIGWVQDPQSGKGLFVEHEGNSKAGVEADIEASLTALVKGRPGHTFGPIETVLHGGTCTGEPVCALVVATYESQPWRARTLGDLHL